jgi:GTPase SAR1 family protein
LAGHSSPRPPASTSSLDALQNDEQRKILNIVDSLRQCGLDGILSLPQLVVCGDQSSGKSSVLEAITEIPFPRKENLCTRFATEIVLRRSPISCIETKIIPDPARPKAEQVKLEKFEQAISDFQQLPRLIDEATKHMGLGDEANGPYKAFAKDVLRIEISGPEMPQLTLVDLPGLIHAENKAQSRDDIQMVSELVDQYISNPRTIILPIVSAKNEYANQIILSRARVVDEHGRRTLGIVTKPDDLHPDSENEASFISLAKNEDIFFALGWHILKNRGFKESNCSFAQRNNSERAFFSQGKWQHLPRDCVGIDSLRTRLSDLLFQHVKKELPKLREELNRKYEETILSLEKLGAKRSNEYEQRQFLMGLSLQFYDLVKAGVNGHYEADFFNIPEESESTLGPYSRRLRAAVQRMNLQFASEMARSGHKYTFEGFIPLDDEEEVKADAEVEVEVEAEAEAEAEDDDNNEDDSASVRSSILPEVLTESEALNWVKQVLTNTRGKELPGNFNPLLIGELFWEQSEKWQSLAMDHIDAVSELCREFVWSVLECTCPADIAANLQTASITDSLKERFKASQVEFKKILTDKRRHPMTYNHYYTVTVQRMRRLGNGTDMKRCLENATTKERVYKNSGSWTETSTVDHDKMISEYHGQIELDMDRHSCRDALNALRAFYKARPRPFPTLHPKRR